MSMVTFQEELSNSSEGITISGEILNNLRFADDTVIITDYINDLPNVMQRLNASCNEYGLDIFVKKTKFMVVTKSVVANTVTDNTDFQRVNAYKYLVGHIDSTKPRPD